MLIFQFLRLQLKCSNLNGILFLFFKIDNDFVNHVIILANQLYLLSLVHALMYEFTLINNLTMLGNGTRDKKTLTYMYSC